MQWDPEDSIVPLSPPIASRAVSARYEGEEEERAPLLKPEALKEREESLERTFALLGVGVALSGCADQLLPASYKALESDLHFSPQYLGLITLCETLAFALTSPVWGRTADAHYPPLTVLLLGCLMWGLSSGMAAAVSTLAPMMVSRAILGVGLAAVNPVAQCVVGEYAEKELGRMFGWIHFTQVVGRLVSQICTTSISNRVILGICPMSEETQDTATTAGATETTHMSDSASVASLLLTDHWRGSLAFLRYPTVQIVIIQGFFAAISLSAGSFLIMYFQYCQIDDLHVALLTGASLAATAMAGPLGGYLADGLNRWSPNHGRLFLGEIGYLLKIPLITYLLLCLPRESSSVPYFAAIGIVMGLSSGWAGVVVVRPILSEIISKEQRATVFAWTIGVEVFASALFGAPLVGRLAEDFFGYRFSPELIKHMDPAQRRGNAQALAHALVATIALPWCLAVAVFSLLHFAYPRDRDREGAVR
ncbi:unnamed protein product [Vitrella brassicaformis CCMP3155]|uniref:Major facilitator superfamily (MFS) profile domain-containing protein n=1 Tax=Vitrella brassicaformis (strain CCMP3155) TaxID=1169540 RepID=A0A0G4GTM0_VITBC|nr:unnamed protein product [Vitrella brassicaformis CCMP3155]|eukprot:CEM34065.1 unnamed protein product [Vitrella brassicaformis CCMP3155]